MQARVPELDKLRGLSILAVILIHSTTRTMNSFETSSLDVIVLSAINLMSRFAVPTFLVVSGFLITRQELAGDGDIAGILRKRVQKVLPPYVVWSSVYFLLFVVTGEVYATQQSLFMIYLEKMVTGTITWHLYFLVLIMQFYFLSYWGLGKNGQVSLFTFTLCGFAQVTFILVNYLLAFENSGDSKLMGKALWYFQAYRHSLFPVFVLYFLFGRWLGANYKEVSDRVEKHQRFLFLALLLSGALAFCEFLLLRDWTHGAVCLPADWSISVNLYAFIFILWALPRLKAAKQPTVNNLLIWLGQLSFILYILHEPLLGYFVRGIAHYFPYANNLQLVIQPFLMMMIILISYAVYRIFINVLPSLWVKIMFGVKKA